ncbi:MAG: glucose-6-phosphate isomerase [Pseudomonadota bacterium]
MSRTILTHSKAYSVLNDLSSSFNQENNHLKHLIQQKNRLKDFSLKTEGLFFDFSKQRLDKKTKDTLIKLAKETQAKQIFSQMVSGEPINTTENRAALHTATRDFSQEKIVLDMVDILPQLKAVNQKIDRFTQKVHDHTICADSGKPFTDAVVIGIGGSYLGCDFVYQALKHYTDPIIKLHFLPNVDIDNFGQIIKSINPETCLWIVISKSYTTTETMANLNQALLFLSQHKLDPSKHLVTITAKGSPGDNPDNPVLDSFHMFDFIGGRYSVTSAVGGLPLSLAFGFNIFNRFLAGCHTMDQHALNAPEETNIPLMSALISIWNSNFLHYPAQAIIPYTSVLSKLAPHVQQLYMESLGKSVTKQGKPIQYQTGVIIFGEPGTNAQHSFFQLAHQGMAFPIEFIGVIKPVFDKDQALSKGVSNHQELWANMIAQGQALAIGKEDKDAAKTFTGNRPSSTILINDLSPESIGMLLGFYEARTVFEGFILGVNPFDQFGVELGKVLASGIRQEMQKKNQDGNHCFKIDDSTARFYLDTLFKGSL